MQGREAGEVIGWNHVADVEQLVGRGAVEVDFLAADPLVGVKAAMKISTGPLLVGNVANQRCKVTTFEQGFSQGNVLVVELVPAGQLNRITLLAKVVARNRAAPG